MKITEGLFSHQVLQRDEKEEARASCRGECAAAGPVQFRLWGEETWQPVGEARDGRWQAQLPPLETGGPYDMELRAGEETLRLEGVLVGDIWLLGGQSNMVGDGELADALPSHPLVSSFTMWDEWTVAEEPLHLLHRSLDAVHNAAGPREPGKGAGLGLPFAVEMVRRTGVPVGLVPCAHGGTWLKQWDPARRDEGGASLYGAMYRRFLAVGGRVKGLLWYQGESDADASAAPLFHDKMVEFIAAVRRDFGNPELPFLQVQIGRVCLDAWEPADWQMVREAQRLTTESISGVEMAVTIDLGLTDGIHLDTQALKILGRRLAHLACCSLFGQEGEMGPRLCEISWDGPGLLRVSCDGVNGGLVCAGRLNGFRLSGVGGGPLSWTIRAQEIDPGRPDSVLLHIVMTNNQKHPLSAEAFLSYGAELDPYANLLDAAGLAAPAFGPLPLPLP